MQIGVTQWVLDKPGAAAIAHAKGLGFDAIQIDCGGWRGFPYLHLPEVKEAYRQASLDSGVQIWGTAPNLFNDVSLTDPNADLTHLIENIVSGTVDFAPLIFVPSFNASELRTDRNIQVTAHWLRLMCDAAIPYGITVATENTLDAAGHLKLIEAVNRPNLKVLIDTLNPTLWGHSAAALVRDLQPHLCDQFHAKDGVNGQMGNAPLGQGVAPFFETFSLVKTLGIGGLWVCENEYGEDAAARAAADIAVLRAQDRV